MDIFMTNTTHRNNIKTFIWCITRMMITHCQRFTIGALEGFGGRNLARINSPSNFTFCSYLRNMDCVIIPFIHLVNSFTAHVFAEIANIFITICSLFIRSIKLFRTTYTPTLMSTWTRRVFVKIRDRFNLFAVVASFCYIWFRHSFFLTKKLCLEPVTVHSVPACFIIPQNYSMSIKKGKYYGRSSKSYSKSRCYGHR